MRHQAINKFSMKFIVIYLIVLLTTVSCIRKPQNKYYRVWKTNSLPISKQDYSVLMDTVENSFMPTDSLTRYDTAFFRTCFAKSVNLWVKGSYSQSFYKILFCKKVPYKNHSINMVKCINSLDSNREDHILAFLVLENVGIVFETNSSMRSSYILEKMVDVKNHQNIIDSNYVKSIYPPSPLPW
jgi:hypothetical protein